VVIQEGCTSVAMEHGVLLDSGEECTGRSLNIVLVCPRNTNQRGDKTDFRDEKNLAHLHRHGLLKGSFLPIEVVELRT